MCVIHMALHSEDLNAVFLASSGNQLLEPLLDTWNVKDLAPVPRIKDKVAVDQGNRGLGTTILILHVYFISYSIHGIKQVRLSSHD